MFDDALFLICHKNGNFIRFESFRKVKKNAQIFLGTPLITLTFPKNERFRRISIVLPQDCDNLLLPGFTGHDNLMILRDIDIDLASDPEVSHEIDSRFD